MITYFKRYSNSRKRMNLDSEFSVIPAFQELGFKEEKKETLYIFPVILEAELNAEVGEMHSKERTKCWDKLRC